MNKLLLCVLLSFSVFALADNAGIPSYKMKLVYSEQKSSQWCWAASIQMVMKYYGIALEQEAIVQRSYGRNPWGQLPDWPGSFQIITQNLNGWGIDRFGEKYVVSAVFRLGAPKAETLVRELERGHPIILGYQTGSNSGHAVVCTAVQYRQGIYGPVVDYITVRDPWPSFQNKQKEGQNVYRGINLASVTSGHWIIRVKKIKKQKSKQRVKVPCQHKVPCVHRAHPFDTLHAFDVDAYGRRFPCMHRVLCQHTLHRYDTAHSYDYIYK